MDARTEKAGRRALDRRLNAWRALGGDSLVPASGWVRAVREALGMPAADLAERMQMTQSAVSRLEESERAGRIQLSTLSRAADALGCDLVYALVPRRPLEEAVLTRARTLAAQDLAPLVHSMALEQQSLDAAAESDALEDYAQALIGAPGLWRARD